MKQIVKTSRLAGQLEKLFRMLNEDFFDGQLETPIITIQSTPRAYGHVSVNSIWTVNGEEKRLSFGVFGHVFTFSKEDLDKALEGII